MVRNNIENPSPLVIQNELRLLAEETGASFSIGTMWDITETSYEHDGTCVKLFERDDEAYIKITVPKEGEDYEDVGNYAVESITDIEFQHYGNGETRIVLSYQSGDSIDHADWGL